jgi:acyl-homoserine lactone acylase PvdQ
MQQHRPPQHGQIANPALAVFVNRQPRAMAATTSQRLRSIRFQRYLDNRGADIKLDHMKTLPEREAGFII